MRNVYLLYLHMISSGSNKLMAVFSDPQDAIEYWINFEKNAYEWYNIKRYGHREGEAITYVLDMMELM